MFFHDCAFVIPVEWKNDGVFFAYAGDGGKGQPVVKMSYVTKLRCKCGREIDRKARD